MQKPPSKSAPVNTSGQRRKTVKQLRGAWAETFASNWLQQQGLIAESVNYHRRVGEIDLIMSDPDSGSWVFVEVKYRRKNAMVSGLEAVDRHKQRRLWRAAQLFLQQQRDSHRPARIDVINISPATAPHPEPSMPYTAVNYLTIFKFGRLASLLGVVLSDERPGVGSGGVSS